MEEEERLTRLLALLDASLGQSSDDVVKHGNGEKQARVVIDLVSSDDETGVDGVGLHPWKVARHDAPSACDVYQTDRYKEEKKRIMDHRESTRHDVTKLQAIDIESTTSDKESDGCSNGSNTASSISCVLQLHKDVVDESEASGSTHDDNNDDLDTVAPSCSHFHPVTVPSLPPLSASSSFHEINSVVIQAIRHHTSLYTRILTFDPISIEQVMAWLQTCNVKCSVTKVKDVLDAQGVTWITESDRRRRTARQKRVASRIFL